MVLRYLEILEANKNAEHLQALPKNCILHNPRFPMRLRNLKNRQEPSFLNVCPKGLS